MSVVRPQPISGLELGHASTDELGADARPDPRLLRAPVLPLLGPVPFVFVEVEDLHSESLDGRDAKRTPTWASVQECPPEAIHLPQREGEPVRRRPARLRGRPGTL